MTLDYCLPWRCIDSRRLSGGIKLTANFFSQRSLCGIASWNITSSEKGDSVQLLRALPYLRSRRKGLSAETC